MTTERAVLAEGLLLGHERAHPQATAFSTRVGYTGGEVKNATYRNPRGHAEGSRLG